MEISSIGIDLSKSSFHIIGLNNRDEIVLPRMLSRGQLLSFTSNERKILIGIEACGSQRRIATGREARRCMPPPDGDFWIRAACLDFAGCGHR